MEQDDWKLLGIAPGASADEIRRAYLRKARAHHPDTDRSAGANERFLRIKAAYERLRGGPRPAHAHARPAQAPTPAEIVAAARAALFQHLRTHGGRIDAERVVGELIINGVRIRMKVG